MNTGNGADNREEEGDEALVAQLSPSPMAPESSSAIALPSNQEPESLESSPRPSSLPVSPTSHAVDSEDNGQDPEQPLLPPAPLLITAPVNHSLNPVVLPEPLPDDARPLNPNGSTPWSVRALAGGASGLSECVSMTASYGFVLPVVLNYMARNDTAAFLNFGGFGGALTQSSAQALVAAVPLAITEYLFFTYVTPLVAAMIGGEVLARDPYDVYPSFKIPPHPGSPPEGDISADWWTAHEAYNAAIDYARLHGFPNLMKRPDPGIAGYAQALANYNSTQQTKRRETAYERLKSEPPTLIDHPGPPVVAGELNAVTQERFTLLQEQNYQNLVAIHNAEVNYLNKCELNHPYLLPPFGPGLIAAHPGFENEAAVIAYDAKITALNADGGFLHILEQKRQSLREGKFIPQQHSVEIGNILPDQVITQCFALVPAMFTLLRGDWNVVESAVSGIGYGVMNSQFQVNRRHNAPGEFPQQQAAHMNAVTTRNSATGLPAGTAPIPTSEPAPISVPTHYVRDNKGLQAVGESLQDAVDEANAPIHSEVEYAPSIAILKKLHNQAKVLTTCFLGDVSGLLASNFMEMLFDAYWKQPGKELAPGLIFLKEYLSNVVFMSGNLAVYQKNFQKNLYMPWDAPAYSSTKDQWLRVKQDLATFRNIKSSPLTEILLGENTRHKRVAAVTDIADHTYNTWLDISLLPHAVAIDKPQATAMGSNATFRSIAQGISYVTQGVSSVRNRYRRVEEATPETLAEANYGEAIEKARAIEREVFVSLVFGQDKSPSDDDIQRKMEEIEESAAVCRESAYAKFCEFVNEISPTSEFDKTDQEKVEEFQQVLRHVRNALTKKSIDSLRERVFVQEMVTAIVKGLVNNTISSKSAATLANSLLEIESATIDHDEFREILHQVVETVGKDKTKPVQTILAKHETMLMTSANAVINTRIATNIVQNMIKTVTDKDSKLEFNQALEMAKDDLSELFESDMSEAQFMQITKAAFTRAVHDQDSEIKKKLEDAEQSITSVVDGIWHSPLVDSLKAGEEEDIEFKLRKEIREKLDAGISAKETIDTVQKALTNPRLKRTPEGKWQLLKMQMDLANLTYEVDQQRRAGQQTSQTPRSIETKKKLGKRNVNIMLKRLIKDGHSLEACKLIIQQKISFKPQGTTRDSMQRYLPQAIDNARNAKCAIDDMLNGLIRQRKSLEQCEEAITSKISKIKSTGGHGPTAEIMRAYLPHAMRLAKYAKGKGFTHGYQYVTLPLDTAVKAEGLSSTIIAVTIGDQNHARIYEMKLGETIGNLLPEAGKPIEGKLTGPAQVDLAKSKTVLKNLGTEQKPQRKKKGTMH